MRWSIGSLAEKNGIIGLKSRNGDLKYEEIGLIVGIDSMR